MSILGCMSAHSHRLSSTPLSPTCRTVGGAAGSKSKAISAADRRTGKASFHRPVKHPKLVKLVLVVAAAILFPALTLAAVPDAEPRPAWCREGFVCVRVEESANWAATIWTLRAENSRLKARARRIGLTAGCGLGVAGVVTDDLETRLLPAATCGVVYGWRF